jgi:hypothetical protein
LPGFFSCRLRSSAAAIAVASVAVAFPRDARATDPGDQMGGALTSEPTEQPDVGASRRWRRTDWVNRSEDRTQREWEVAGVVSYLTPPIHGGTTPFGAGFGGRLGFVASNVYVGAKVIGYLGGRDVDLSDNAVVAGVEVGYALRLVTFGSGHFALRPELGLGDAIVSHTDPSLAKVDVVTSASGHSSSSTTSDTITLHSLYVAPALRAMLISSGRFLAMSGTAMILPSINYGGAADAATWVSYGFQGELGFRF